MARSKSLGKAGAKQLGKSLGLSPQVTQKLVEIQAEVDGAYREAFVEMVRAINRQASALERIQNTLAILVEQTAPQLKGQAPAAIRIAGEDEDPDLASALMVADPIAAGYTLTQSALAEALGLSAPDVSVLVRAFELPDDDRCAVVVRGGKRAVVNYHPRAIQRFKELVANPPKGLTQSQERLLGSVRKKLL